MASETLAKLAEAMVKVQGELKNPAFDSKNPHFNSQFVSFAGLRDAVLPVCNKHGIAVIQSIGPAEHGIVCRTRLLHTSGEWIEDETTFPASKADPQGYAAAVTYARRYSLQSMVCVVGDEDDDGNRAAAKAALPEPNYDRKPAAKPAAPRPPVPRPDAPQPEDSPNCPDCGAAMELRHGKRGDFWGCVNYRKTGCRGARDAVRASQVQPPPRDAIGKAGAERLTKLVGQYAKLCGGDPVATRNLLYERYHVDAFAKLTTAQEVEIEEYLGEPPPEPQNEGL